MNECDLDRTVIEHANKFAMINTKLLSWVSSLVSFQFSVSRSYIHMFQINKVGHILLLGMSQEVGLKYIILEEYDNEKKWQDDVEEKVGVSNEEVEDDVD